MPAVADISPQAAMSEAVRDMLITQYALLDADHCDNQDDGQPPPTSGQYYVSVFDIHSTPRDDEDAAELVDWSIGVGIGISQRTTIVPEDRQYRDAIWAERGVGTMGMRIIALMKEQRWHLLRSAELLQSNAPKNDVLYPGVFVEPMHRTSGFRIVDKGANWFRVPPERQSERCVTGLYLELTYGNGRYMHSLL